MITGIVAALLIGASCLNVAGAGIEPDVNDLSGAFYYEEADYDSLEFTSRTGNKTYLNVRGGDLIMDSNCAYNVEIKVKEFRTYKQVASDSYRDGQFTWSIADKLKTDRMYYVPLAFTADDIDYEYIDIFITKDDNGDLRFVKSPVYDFNASRCSEMWTDAKSLDECLQAQNDVDCTDPLVVDVSNSICAGLSSDWDKVFAIYTYIISEFAYDDIQLKDGHYVYQDDCASLIRRKIGICEGFGNLFAALCRVQKIPAVVEFGITETFETFLTDKAKRDSELANHAWAAVFLGDKWYFVDPTFDCSKHFVGNSRNSGVIKAEGYKYDYFLVSLEMFSMKHKILDADTIHGIESSGSCGHLANYTISRDGTLTISGSGEVVMPDGVNGFNKVVFAPGSNITSIGYRCFIDCDLITEIRLPDTVTEIKDQAFNTCEDLKYIYLPEGLKSIGQEAFDFCDELAYVYVPDSVVNIGKFAFDDCPRLIISVPSHLKHFTANNYVEPYRIIVR